MVHTMRQFAAYVNCHVIRRMTPMDVPPAAELGAKIRERRLARSMTQEKLAEVVDTTSQTIGRLEAGSRGLSVVWLYRISAALECQPAELLGIRLGDQENRSALAHVLCAIERHWVALGTEYARGIFVDELRRHFPHLEIEDEP